MLTGCRRLESGSLKWSDVDLEAKTFTLRADVVKNHSALTLPMSDVLFELVKARSEADDDSAAARRRRSARSREYVFASNGRKSPFITNAQATVEALSKVAGTHVHLHAMRRTFDDIAQACRIDGDVRRMLLNHIHGDVHSRHYANGSESLTPAVDSIAKWIVDAAHVADDVASGRNVIAFTG
jgi:integrase